MLRSLSLFFCWFVLSGCTIFGADSVINIASTEKIYAYSAEWLSEFGLNDFGNINATSNPDANIFNYYFINSNAIDLTGCSAPVLSDNLNFSIVENQCTADHLASANSCLIKIKAQPQIPGIHKAVLSRRCDEVGTVGVELVAKRVSIPSIISQLAAGTNHNCVVYGSGPDAGKVKCWGNDSYGQVGDNDGAKKPNPTPVFVTGLTDVSTVSLGSTHSCALLGTGLDAGKVKCWGRNNYGQLGQGTTDDSDVPLLVSGLVDVVQLSAGYDHTCAFIGGAGVDAGKVKCWGRNNYGQLGDSTQTNRLTPVTVLGGLVSNIVQLSVGGYHSCVLLGFVEPDAGEAKCWGYNVAGQVADGSWGSVRSVPTVYAWSMDDLTQMASGLYNNCAVVGGVGADAGKVKCWGSGYYGQNGDGTTSNRLNGGTVAGGLVDVEKVFTSSSSMTTCALIGGSGVDQGKLKCWGSNRYRQISIDENLSSENKTVPVIMQDSLGHDILNVSQVVMGSQHVCVLINEGSASAEVKCWGGSLYEIYGDGSSGNAPNPLTVKKIENISAVSQGARNTCALVGSGADAGKVKCWGWNGYGERGMDPNLSGIDATFVTGLTNVAQISAGGYHACALIGSGADAGRVKCWGYNGYGSVGNNTTTSAITATFVSSLTEATQIMSGLYHSCALIGGVGVDAGKVKCWGMNDYGQIGDATSGTNRLAPVLVSSLSNVSQVSVGGYHSCVVIGSGADVGKVKCWGSNSDGQLGNGTYSDGSFVAGAAEVLEIKNISKVTSGLRYSCALIGSGTDSGKVKCWGKNDYGQTGQSLIMTQVVTPALVENLVDVVDIIATGSGTCALIGGVGVDAGKVKCWGKNDYGFIGDGTFATKNKPSLRVLNGSSVLSLGSGSVGSHMCLIMTDNKVQCSGYNNYNQVTGSLGGYIRTVIGL